MAQLDNTPAKGNTILQLEARKSFEFSVRVTDRNENPCDLTGSTMTIVMKKPPLDYGDTVDATNLIENDIADLTDAVNGMAWFHLQATDFYHRPGEYPFAITLRTPEGYSIVIVKGVIEILENTEFASISSDYVGANPPIGLHVILQGNQSVQVFIGSIIPPGKTWMSEADVEKLDGFPPGGHLGQVLMKASDVDYETKWEEANASAAILPATGVPAGQVPTASGADTWEWRWPPNNDALVMGPVDLNTVTISAFYYWPNAADVTAPNNFPAAGEIGYLQVNRNSPSEVMQSYTTTAGRRFLRVSVGGTWSSWIEQSPVGHVHDAAAIETGVLDKNRTQRVIDLRGIARGTAAPTGGVDGDLYIQYTP